MPDQLPTGTVTFLFTDIEGSTRLLRRLGDGYPPVLERHGAIVRGAVATHEGVVVNSEGDGFFAVFRSARQAVAAAVEVQRDLAQQPWPDECVVRVRMGLHTGEGRLGGADYAGLDVHRSARIAAAGHGGQVLLSASTMALVESGLPDGVTTRDLGTHHLKDLPEPEALVQLVIPGLADEFPALRSLESPLDMPLELTSFVGRRRELDEVRSLLATTRLVTLTGPGGTGKTRLAIRVGSGMRPEFRDGIRFVDLSPLTDPSLVASTIGRSLGLREQGSRPMAELLKEHLRVHAILLILDNFEHLLPAGGLVEELLATAPTLRVLVTSRSVLNLYGEQEYAVPPLGLPSGLEATDPDAPSASEAVALFTERARAAKPSFALTSSNAKTVVEICMRLDGLPLAIELVASRVRVIEPHEILARLERRLPVLAAGGSSVPTRQRTLRGAIDWSFDLLPPRERALFVRLAVFAGGCTLEAVDVVCNPAGELEVDTFDGVASLVDKSLIRQVATPAGSRFRMLETIREYGLDRGTADGTISEVLGRHSTFFRDLGELAEQHFLQPDQADWLDRFEAEHDNVRAVLRRSVDAGDAETGLRLAAATWRFWLQRGYLREGRSWLEALLALQTASSPRVQANAWTALGGLAYWLADVDATEAAYEASLRLFAGIGDRSAEAEALYNRSFIPVMLGDNDEARRRLEASIALARDVARPDVVALAEHSLGIVLTMAGEPRAGIALQEASLAFFRATGNRFQVAWTLSGMGQAYAVLGERAQARAMFVESLKLHAEARNLPGIGASLQVISSLESTGERHAAAVRLAAAVDAVRTRTGASPPAMFSQEFDVEAAARQAIDDEAVDAAIREGKAMTLEEVVDYAVGLEE